ncbi:alpha/beta fold hydrolase [Mucilaginibacter limnophilus]|uniref:Alpha/beta fold hydrolase n=1 Tax=Mucilaginibacter limnophilus TaxID=1932778 RepID=A0A3S2UIX4_9SPHI|nr:alpha/beta hydrolase [Mucilaginibacter limnophilus]RVT97298.1 alpha/beta fold hydrolase [Mucilaginibacter limnophilus]
MRKLYVLLILFIVNGVAVAQIKPVDSFTDGKYVNVNGAKLWVVTVGEGDPIIFIAGGPGGVHLGLRSFDKLAENHHQLIYFDAFGRGKSDTAKKVTEYTLERDIDDIEGLRKALKLNKVTVLGHSYGGVVAQGYAIKYPEHLSHVILANTFHSFIMWQENDDNSNHEIRVNYPEIWAELMKIREQGAVSSDEKHQEIYGKVPYGFLYAYNPDKFVRKAGNRKPYPNPNNTKLYYQMVGKDGDFIVGSDIGTFDYRKDLKNLKMPVLILSGRFDRVATPWQMVKYKDYCPQAQFVMFEKSGHNPQVEEPEKEFEVINAFLAK